MTTPRDEWASLIKLRRVTSREDVPLADLLLRCGDPESACTAPQATWREVCGFVPDADRLGPEADLSARRRAAELEALGANVVDVRQAAYPESLRRLPQPPLLLFTLGRIELLRRPAIAVVGTRRHSPYGRDSAVSMVVGLVRTGYVIVSGLARGIDSVAHQSALDVGGDTVAVLGNGLDVVYPPEAADLRSAIAAHGCLLSEFPPGTPPLKHHFPQRNRIIAGLSAAVLVIEAAERSGALITADYALEEGKEVLAVPGPIHNPMSRGTNRLIQDGAALVTSAADVLRVLEARGDRPSPSPADPVPAGAEESEPPTRAVYGHSPEPAASGLARRLWAALAEGSRDLESLTAVLGTTPQRLGPALLELELAGLIERQPGPRFGRRAPGAGRANICSTPRPPDLFPPLR